MAAKDFIFTSESVGEGHPDKVADRISDAILDSFLALDPKSRVACETLVKNEMVILAGEITSTGTVQYDKVVRDAVRDIGYNDPAIGFDAKNCEILTFISKQSPDISLGVDASTSQSKEQGAGDQGLMFGFACNETPELMPLPIALSHRLVRELAISRKKGTVKFLRPDAKSQVTVQYSGGKPVAVDTIVVSTQHDESVSQEQLRDYVVDQIVPLAIPTNLLNSKTKYLINPTGRFIIGGPVGDCGLTGRKIIVDTYGGYSRHGGGAFSGKDPSKVDRSAAYMARYIAKNVVAAGLAEKCEVQIAYAIGVAKPVSVFIDTFGTGKISEDKISAAVMDEFKLTPRGIIESLDLLRPIYQATSAYGHFGQPAQNGFFPWEKTDKAAALKGLK